MSGTEIWLPDPGGPWERADHHVELSADKPDLHPPNPAIRIIEHDGHKATLDAALRLSQAGVPWAQRLMHHAITTQPGISRAVVELCASQTQTSEKGQLNMSHYTDASNRRVYLEDRPLTRSAADPQSFKDAESYRTSQRPALEDAYGELPQHWKDQEAENAAAHQRYNSSETQDWVMRARTDPSNAWREARDDNGQIDPAVQTELDRQGRGGIVQQSPFHEDRHASQLRAEEHNQVSMEDSRAIDPEFWARVDQQMPPNRIGA